MKHIAPKDLERAFVAPGTPMLSDVVRYLHENPELFDDTRTRDMISGLRRLAAALGRAPEEVPADPKWLQPRVAKVAPAALGISPKTWSNVLSNAQAGMARFGIVEKRRRRRQSDLSRAWRELWDMVLASGDLSLRTALCRFVHFLSTQSTEPAGAYEMTRRLLGHSATSHTLNLYTGLETRAVTAAFSRLIADRKGKSR
jgi:hypothetical protein